jgi:putative IMPACT (imprinted ancient) family translation regulator
MSFIGEIRDPDATHNCWAYRIGPTYRFSDDGEPAGTAGRPILTAIERQGIDHAVVVVTRYFGGIKLGAGGLARAYGGTAAACLRGAQKRILEEMRAATVMVPFACISQAYGLVDRAGLRRDDAAFTDQGVRFSVHGPRSVLDGFVTDLATATSGAARVSVAEGP